MLHTSIQLTGSFPVLALAFSPTICTSLAVSTKQDLTDTYGNKAEGTMTKFARPGVAKSTGGIIDDSLVLHLCPRRPTILRTCLPLLPHPHPLVPLASTHAYLQSRNLLRKIRPRLSDNICKSNKIKRCCLRLYNFTYQFLQHQSSLHVVVSRSTTVTYQLANQDKPRHVSTTEKQLEANSNTAQSHNTPSSIS